jgi:hypothetical protein
MKRFATVLTVTLIILALPGCVQDKPAPRLDSSDRTERIEAVRQAQNRYGRRAAPAENQPAQPPPVPAVQPMPSLLAIALAGDNVPIVGRWNHSWTDSSYVQFNADGTFKWVALLRTAQGTWRLLSADTVEMDFPGIFYGRTVVEIKYRLNGNTLELDEGLGPSPFTKAR